MQNSAPTRVFSGIAISTDLFGAVGVNNVLFQLAVSFPLVAAHVVNKIDVGSRNW